MIAYTYCTLPSEELLDSMIAPTNGDLYKNVTNRIYAAPKTFERIENWKELYNGNN